MAKKILVVDDSKVVGKLLSTSLASQGYETLTATSVDEAIATLKEKGPVQMVITDLIMPDKDGIELIDHIHKTMSPYDRPKIIVISGGSKGTVTAETAVMSVKDRVDKVMMKPFTQDVLLSAVNGLLNIKPAA